ncbi:MAG: prepilin-type N-terminal cleavage/methylation domain-containing protein [Pirellulaceae bacterium]|nr:prepilin-type N-terminal cleavage/methylation domain-containing protein [Pirellulaceae bacterium]
MSRSFFNSQNQICCNGRHQEPTRLPSRQDHDNRQQCRQGMTFLELMISMTILSAIVGTMGIIALSMEAHYQNQQGRANASQHARVVFERINRVVHQASSNNVFPGLLAVDTDINGVSFPGTLVVWKTDRPIEKELKPLYSELIVFSFDPDRPQNIVQFQNLSDTREVPPIDQTGTWKSEIAAFKANGLTTKLVLTKLLRTRTVADSNSVGILRFKTRYLPSEEELESYKNKTKSWELLTWPTTPFQKESRLRQVLCQTEIQLLPTAKGQREDPTGETSIAFFGSSTHYYPLNKNELIIATQE